MRNEMQRHPYVTERDEEEALSKIFFTKNPVVVKAEKVSKKARPAGKSAANASLPFYEQA